MSKLNDAEVEGDEVATGRLLAELKNRERFPIKLLQFHQDVRPPYWGMGASGLPQTQTY